MALSLKRVLIYLVGAGSLLLLGNILLVRLENRPADREVSRAALRRQIDLLNAKAKLQAEQEQRLQNELSKLQTDLKAVNVRAKASKAVDAAAGNAAAAKSNDLKNADLVLPILVFACNRPTAVVKALDDLIRYRPSKEKFPIIVTQDCGHDATRIAIEKYKNEIHKHIMQPVLAPIPNLTKKEKKLEGYFKISRHYKWALGQIFDVMKYKAAIIMEDDLNISPDFYEYFEATHRLLIKDPTLYCVSAWNDNGKAKHIDDKPELLYRSDFFPGLGWMILDTLWDEYRDTWPKGFWDDWVRQSPQRKGRACIRPEISRTHTFGEKGVSLGMFYKTHLKFMILNDKKIEWTKMDLSYLKKDNYDSKFLQDVYGSHLISLKDLEQAARDKAHKSVRITYSDKNSFKVLAKALDLMNDFKDGMPRTAYRGVVTKFFKGIRVYLTPPSTWSKYDPSWT